MIKKSAKLVRRALVTLLGTGVLLVGVFLLAAPGPGFLVIALGFGILSSEYAWARRGFEVTRSKAADLADQAAANTVSSAFSFVFSLAVIGAGILWIVDGDLPGSGPATGASLIFGGLVILATLLVSLRQESTDWLRGSARENAPDNVEVDR